MRVKLLKRLRKKFNLSYSTEERLFIFTVERSSNMGSFWMSRESYIRIFEFLWLADCISLRQLKFYSSRITRREKLRREKLLKLIRSRIKLHKQWQRSSTKK